MRLDIPKINPATETERLIAFIRHAVRKLGRNGVVLGLSGGLDSSVTAVLAKNAFPRNSLALILPDKDNLNENISHAEALAKKIQLPSKKINITPTLMSLGTYSILPRKISTQKEDILSKLRKQTGIRFLHGIKPQERPEILQKIALVSMHKLRLRMILIYEWAYRNNYAVLGTTNRTEHAIGQFDKYGDGAADISPLSHLYKTQLRTLARYLGLSSEVVSKPACPDIVRGFNSEDMWGISERELDKALYSIEHHPLSAKRWDNSGKGYYNEIVMAVKNARLRDKAIVTLPETII